MDYKILKKNFLQLFKSKKAANHHTERTEEEPKSENVFHFCLIYNITKTISWSFKLVVIHFQLFNDTCTYYSQTEKPHVEINFFSCCALLRHKPRTTMSLVQARTFCCMSLSISLSTLISCRLYCVITPTGTLFLNCHLFSSCLSLRARVLWGKMLRAQPRL